MGIAGAMGATLGRGIAPDVHISWTPAQLSHDIELETACERVTGYPCRRIGAKMTARLRFNLRRVGAVPMSHSVLPGR